MAIKFHSGDRVTGLSTDAKPMFVATNSVFYETDTNKTYDFNGSAWTERPDSITESEITGTISDSKLAGNISLSKIASGTAGKIVGFNSSTGAPEEQDAPAGGDGAPVMPHNTTIGDYTLPSATDSTGNTFTKVGDYEADFTNSSTATGWSTLGNNLPVDGDTHIDGGFATIDFTYNPDIYQNAQNTDIGDDWRHVLDFTDSNVLGRGLTSTWVARFRFRVNSAYMGSGGSNYLHVVADFIPTSESSNGEINYRKDSNGSGGTRARQFTSFNSQYVEVIQTSSNRIFNGYTDSTYTTRAVVDPDPIQNTHTDSTGYTTGFQFKYKHTGGQKNYNGDVSDFKIWENTSSPAGNNFHIDNDTASRFVTPAMVNPIIQADLTASTRCSHIAIHTHSDTTETEVEIQTSTDNSTWTTQRTINVSNLTHGGYNYIRFNPVQARYVRVRGSSGASKVLAISNIKVLNGVADSALIETHGHLSISKTDGTLPVEG